MTDGIRYGERYAERTDRKKYMRYGRNKERNK
jgi:FMRFamide related peptide family.